MITIQFVNASVKGYKYIIGEPTNARSQHVTINKKDNHQGDVTIIDEAYFEDYEMDGKLFKAPVTEIYKRPTFITVLIDIEKTLFNVYKSKPNF